MIKCWHNRRIISRSADNKEPLPPAAQAHVAECQDCRRIYETEHEIVRRLSAGAAGRKQRQPPPFLHARIMARITSPHSGARRASPFSPLLRPAVLAAVCIVLTTILLRPGTRPSPGQIARVQPPRRVAAFASMAWPDTTLLAEWTTNPDKPLEAEMRSVVHDARGAVTVLADNFFPKKLRQTLLSVK
jgi:hypothetical protein